MDITLPPLPSGTNNTLMALYSGFDNYEYKFRVNNET